MSLQAEVFAGFLSHGKTCEGVSAIALRGPAEEFLSMTPVLESPGDVRVRETAPVSEVRALGSVPTVDVVIPCYRYGRYLRRCVESVVGQRDVNVRILILDDASPDDSAEIGAALAVEYPQVEFRQHVTNAGHIATYNEGLIGGSESAYCMLLSADDLLAPGALGRAVRIMERDPSIGMVYGRAIHFYDEHQLPVGRVRSAGTLYFEGRSGSGVVVTQALTSLPHRKWWFARAFSAPSAVTGRSCRTAVISRCGCASLQCPTSPMCGRHRRSTECMAPACSERSSSAIWWTWWNGELHSAPFSDPILTSRAIGSNFSRMPTGRWQRKCYGTHAGCTITDQPRRSESKVWCSSR
jgi:hypothetical protein